ncbi:hypothetical protein EV368DRAFT_70255 [Lentinula lateritia]|nr:hypothetical protein EV368DRAFT_70255 [Lentinula lateritia]
MSSLPVQPVQTSIERPQLVKKDLIQLVERQITKWPTQQPFQRSKVLVKDLRSNLLNPSNGFTTTVPLTNIPTLRKPRHAQDSSALNSVATSFCTSSSSVGSNHPDSMQVSLSSTTPNSNVGLKQSQISSDSSAPTLILKLLINDTRYHQEGIRRSQVITVPSVNQSEHAPEYAIKFIDLFHNLQKTNTMLEGIGELTFCDPDEPDYGQILMKGEFRTTIPDSELLIVTNSKTLKLNVTPYPSLSISSFASGPLQNESSLTSSSNTTATTVVIGSSQYINQLLNDPNSKPLRIAESVHAIKKGPKSKMISELVIEASKLPGHATFTANRHRVLLYNQVAAHWEFAASFSATHFHKQCPITYNIKSKKAIAKALGIQSTSLSAAEQGHELIQLYGAGGSHESSEVVNEVESGKTGAMALMDFLRKWEADHPVTGSKAEKRRLKLRKMGL